MSSALRQRFAAVLLACVVVWPPVHHVLVRTFEMDPWAFFGFAMYAAPNLRSNVRAGVIGPEADATPDWNALPRELRGELRRYASLRARLGELYPPDALAREIFARAPELPGLVIRVRRWELARDSARLRSIDRDYRYAPPGLPDPG